MFNPPATLPLKQTLLLLTTVLPEILIHHMLIPLYPYMTRVLLPGQGGTGYYAGILQSAYALPTTFMDAVWGNLSDSIGRGPILMSGLLGYGVGTVLLGLSTSYWLSVLSLGATGFFSSNAVVAKGMIGEIATDDASRAWAYGAYGVVFSLAGLGGTLVGGFLADPELWSHIPFLRERPYFVACSVGTVLAALGAVVTYNYLLGETNRRPHRTYAPLISVQTPSMDSMNSSDDVIEMPTRASCLPRALPSLLRPYLQIVNVETAKPILLYTAYKLSHSLFHAALPLLASAPVSSGGFGLPAKSTSVTIALLTTAKLITKGCYFPIHQAVGTRLSYCIGCALIIPAACIPPLFGHIAMWPSIYVATLFVGVGEGLCYLSTIMLLTDSVGPWHYGLVHGLAGCMGSLMKTIGPIVSGAVWELGVTLHHIWLIFVVVALVSAIGIVAGLTMDLRKWEAPDPSDDEHRRALLREHEAQDESRGD
ncbi:hypothetical protein HKX48_009544 [Thoreauomyces humboldtii]|nr:hypothetical protein HKX48_009544 [Thoreauomyces humboldtii]